MAYSYRLLSGSDVIYLKKLLKVFGEAFGETETYQKEVPSDAYLKSLLNENNFMALVALRGEDVVGGLTAYELKKPEQERKEVYIYDLAVAESHRRKGVATGLINALKKISKVRGAYIIYVQADKIDTGAINLYQSFGTKEDVFHFDIPVD